MKNLCNRAVLLGLMTACSVTAGLVWGGAPSQEPGMPAEVFSMRDVILTRGEYQHLADQWRTYLDDNPASAAAHIQLARALYYADPASTAEQNALIRQAQALDPDCPEVLDALARTGLHSGTPLVDSLEVAYRYGQRAVELAPGWSNPHFTLWSLAVVLQREEEAWEHLRAMVTKGGIPSPLLDFGHNLLMSAESGGIIFTNGDNDTYPPLALQVVHGTRPDVEIFNLSLLNRLEYARGLGQNVREGPRPFTERELEELFADFKRNHAKSGELFSAMVVRAMCEKVRDGKWGRPVYFALTVVERHLAATAQALVLEGLLWRIEPTLKAESESDEPLLNRGRTELLFREEFRLDSSTDLAFPWTKYSGVRPLMINYPAVLLRLATAGAEAGDMATARYALHQALPILEFHHKEEWLRQMVDFWRGIDPDNPELDRWH